MFPPRPSLPGAMTIKKCPIPERDRARPRLSIAHVFARGDGPQSALARHGSPLSAEIVLCVHSTIFSGEWGF